MKRPQTEFEQLLEVESKITKILKEYNCAIEFDEELKQIIIHDKYSNQFLVPF